MKKHILYFLLPLATFSLIFLILTPHFTEEFLDIRQQQENERLALEKLKYEAEQRIYLAGKFDPAQREGFVLIPFEYTIDIMNQYNLYLRKETFEAFLKMRDAANADQIDLKIASATRNFDYQKELWNNQWNGVTAVDNQNLLKSIPDEEKRFKKILQYIAVPGISRHHWGTDIDINGANLSYFRTEKGKKEYVWLSKNAYLYGFCQVYNLKGSSRTMGYNEEKWHWSYMPLSRNLAKEYKDLIKDTDISGFDGDIYAINFNLINDYVLSINPECI